MYRIGSSDSEVDLVMGHTGMVEGVSHSKLKAISILETTSLKESR